MSRIDGDIFWVVTIAVTIIHIDSPIRYIDNADALVCDIADLCRDTGIGAEVEYHCDLFRGRGHEGWHDVCG